MHVRARCPGSEKKRRPPPPRSQRSPW
jgi:hypothetical protein